MKGQSVGMSADKKCVNQATLPVLARPVRPPTLMEDSLYKIGESNLETDSLNLIQIDRCAYNAFVNS